MGSGCKDLGKCLEILDLILDQEGSAEQEEFLFNHIQECSCCLEHYNLEVEFRKVVKKSLKSEEVPSELIESIKSKIITQIQQF